MANLENAAGRVIHTIRDRLTRTQAVRDTGRAQSAEERLLGLILHAETPIKRMIPGS